MQKGGKPPNGQKPEKLSGQKMLDHFFVSSHYQFHLSNCTPQ